MAQECGFFNAQMVGDNEYDRVYLAEQFAAYFASFIGNGVFGQSMQKLQVKAQDNPDMSVKVLSGEAWINGWWYRNTDEHVLSLDMPDGTLKRIDLIVLRWGNRERDMWLDVIKGTPSFNPVVPSLRRDVDYYDLQLAAVTINSGVIRVTQSAINDTRLDNDVCGLVTGVVDQIDTTGLYDQFNKAFLEFQEGESDSFVNWLENQMAIYLAWFESLQGKLGEDPATDLQNQILQLQAKHPSKLIADIIHELHTYPECTLFETTYACGTQGAGYGPAGGGSLISTPVETEMVGKDRIKIMAVDKYEEVDEVIQVAPLEYALLFKNNTTRSLYCILDDRVSRTNDYLKDYNILDDRIDSISDYVAGIGEFSRASGSKVVTPRTDTECTTLNLRKGTYVIVAFLDWTESSSAMTIVNIYNDTQKEWIVGSVRDLMSSGGGQSLAGLYYSKGEETVTLHVYHADTVNHTARFNLKVVRVGDVFANLTSIAPPDDGGDTGGDTGGDETDPNAYGFQGIGGQTMKMTKPSDIVVLEIEENEAGEITRYTNMIENLDPENGVYKFEFTMSADMNNFDPIIFQQSSLPYIQLFDMDDSVVENPVYGGYDATSKTITLNVPAGELGIETDYVLRFGAKVQGNSSDKTLGVPIDFVFVS